MKSQMLDIRVLALFIALTAMGLACTDVDVFETHDTSKMQSDNRLTVIGNFCTEYPDELDFPVKIMFIVDCSQSMSQTDPPPSPNEYPGRVRAVWDVIQKFRYDPGVSFAIVRFSGSANVSTQADTNGDGFADMFGFVNDLPSLLRALNSLQAAGGNTSYQAALGLAEATLAMDMSMNTVQERARSRYIVIFLTDGLPYPQGNGVNTPASIRDAVRELVRLKDRFKVRELSFHTALLATGMPEYVEAEADKLLQSMAEIGGGTFRSFPNGESINYLDINFTSVKRMYEVKDGSFLVFNDNADPAWNINENIDTDGDGLVDIQEAMLGTDPGLRDTDGDGFSDYLEERLKDSGFDPLDPNDADCRTALERMDRDGDTLLDCEERFIGTSPDLFDSDSDGIPDNLEVRAGTSPVDNDSDTDKDFDGSLNGDEIAWHTNPGANDAAFFSKRAYRYHFTKKPGVYESRFCYQFKVDNITLVGTQARTKGGLKGFNDVMVYAGEVPLDNPKDYGTFRVACARVRYIPRYPEPDVKYPPSGVVRLEQKDFKRPVATRCSDDEECPHFVCDPSNHLCLAPLGEKCDENTPCPHFTCAEDPRTGVKNCIYPIRSACSSDEDCPPYPINKDTGLCMDSAKSTPDPITGLCPRRICEPVYPTCTVASDCPDNRDSDPDNDDDCVSGFCRSPCAGSYACNAGETCEQDLPGDYKKCTSPADCDAGQQCEQGLCQTPCTSASDCPNLTDTCVNNFCASHHCVDHHGGICAGVPCTADGDCPVEPCDPELKKCRIQPCVDSRECPNRKCEPVLGVCTGVPCESNEDCRGERGYTCNALIGEPCDRDIDCPYRFCSGKASKCSLSDDNCQKTGDCPVNPCQNIDPVSGLGTCALSGTQCQVDMDCPPNMCNSYRVCLNDPSRKCDTDLTCPQHFCSTDHTCINDPSITCNPDTESTDRVCETGFLCHRENGLGNCDTLEQESCSSDQDCPYYKCNPASGRCDYPGSISCSQDTPCPEADMICDAGFCYKPCSTDEDCAHIPCKGRCVPSNPSERKRCTDWFDADRDCVKYGE
ncbi:MAG: VWA domain-containing protein [Deltaproteobacteria bacterium]|nr:VWA domain-containing protein [Deltaproteobacteria bacterium]